MLTHALTHTLIQPFTPPHCTQSTNVVKVKNQNLNFTFFEKKNVHDDRPTTRDSGLFPSRLLPPSNWLRAHSLFLVLVSQWSMNCVIVFFLFSMALVVFASLRSDFSPFCFLFRRYFRFNQNNYQNSDEQRWEVKCVWTQVKNSWSSCSLTTTVQSWRKQRNERG